MKKVVLVIFLSVTSCLYLVSCGGNTVKDEKKSISADTIKYIYICPMDTDIKSDKLGECSKCGMDLEKVIKSK